MGKRIHLPRAILIYLVAIVAPALVLLIMGLKSVQRQHQAVRALAESNRALAAEKLAVELERRTRQLAEECLRNQPPSGKPHPLVQRYFEMRAGAVVLPRLDAPPPRGIPGLPAVFREAEDLELRQARTEQALEGYRRAHEIASDEAGKALALSRVARCLEKLGRQKEAGQIWRTLLDQYGDVYDPSHRPHGLTARLQLGQNDELYQDLIQDRWNLSAEQFDYYLARLNRKAPASHRFVLARELDEQFHHAGPLREEELYSFTLPNFRIYYRVSGQQILGLSVNSEWISQHLAPRVRAELGLPDAPPPNSSRDLWIYGAGSVLVLSLLILGVVFVVRDVTREARLNQLRADFVSGVSHELKTPLTLIRLYSETLLRKDYPAEERRGFYEIITRESERLSHLIQKVLSFSRIERGEKEYSLAEGDLGDAIGRTIDVYRQYLEHAGFAVETSLAGTLPSVRFDADAISQAVVNLLDNAVKYSGDRKFIAIRLHPANGGVVLEVQDQGIGIAPGEREKIFERFYRAANGGAKGGYGLGLFLVRHIMDAHNGRVEVEGEYGSGSCFRLVFPAAS